MDKKLQILNMVSEGKLTPEQAARLLEALGEDAAETGVSPVLPPPDYDMRMFRVTVDTSSGDRVSVQFPVKGIKKIIRATGRLPINVDGMEGVDMSEMMDGVIDCLESQVVGDLVSADSASGDRIRIFVE